MISRDGIEGQRTTRINGGAHVKFVVFTFQIRPACGSHESQRWHAQIGDRLMRLLTTFTLLMIGLPAIGQTFPTKSDEGQQPLTYYPDKYVDTESKYTDSGGKGVIIQNSLPKGGAVYTDF